MGKINYTPFIAPDADIIAEHVEQLGGVNEVARICHKNSSTVSRWCSGIVGIDYANWKVIVEAGMGEKELIFKIMGKTIDKDQNGTVYEQKELEL